MYEHAEEEARRRTGLTKDDWRARNAPLVQRILASGDYPAVSQFVERAQDLDPETAFGTALRRILDGIQASLPSSPRGNPPATSTSLIACGIGNPRRIPASALAYFGRAAAARSRR